ncbi:DNA cytosine methyltransferase [Acidomonas methanolica]|uniref:Uncharacterized protein n=1 Tax=Acidomonas methanolica NBRC 104435 TaxID=1231351 RepID=A0A023D6R0_ACIMT|nr:DNA cytosine methyltransferase [Acidomonas methanolica]TCS23823.1 hypothetical protein EDC31_12741 [Acidomonas methanolica]GAJ29833.1 hypothetical protein Amme_083_008 [Acidomonas methanolica NBRC 104435]GBQ52910.1 hypothetical protein AA0498_1831 [Acidomonas methanolica]GEL00182.1 hypothetical protein AME01nite_26800 [Acidomonas methanolica NBRC 104435]
MIRAATLCSGIGAPETAMPDWEWLWASEIEAFPSRVLARRFPHTVNLGDTTIAPNGATLRRIRALVAIASAGVQAGDLGGYIERESNLHVSGDARVELRTHIGWCSIVGCENGTLTWFRDRSGGVLVNRGCFNGTLDDFEGAVRDRHGDSQTGHEYQVLIEFIHARTSAWEPVSEAKEVLTGEPT